MRTIPIENHLAQGGRRQQAPVLTWTAAHRLCRTCFRAVVEVLSCSWVECYRFRITILQKRGVISHVDGRLVHNELTGQTPGLGVGLGLGLGLGGFGDLGFPSINRRFNQVIVQEDGRVGPRRGVECGGQFVGGEVLGMRLIYERGQSESERPRQFNARRSGRSFDSRRVGR